MSENIEELSNEARQKLDAYYKNQNLPNCPTCNSNKDVIPAVRGKPSRDLMLYAQQGHVKLSGCTQGYEGWCTKCQKFFRIYSN